MKFYAVVLLLVSILSIFMIVKTPQKQQVRPQIDLSYLAAIPFWDQDRAFQSFQTNVHHFDYLSLFWYTIDEDGKVQKFRGAAEDQSIIDFAKQENVKVLGLVANLVDDDNDDEDWDTERVGRVLGTPTRRAEHINNLLQLVEQKDFDGINIDYEGLEEKDRENFSLFLEELAEKLHGRGKILGVAIHPKTSQSEEEYGTGGQDIPRIANASDHLYYMTYLEHGKSSQPGPAGSVGWIEKVINVALSEKVPPEKIFMGVGLFGQEWVRYPDGSVEGVNTDLTFDDIQPIIDTKNAYIRWDNNTKTNYLEYTTEDRKHIIGFEDRESVGERIALAKRLGIGGIGYWRLGGEDPTIWSSDKK